MIIKEIIYRHCKEKAVTPGASISMLCVGGRMTHPKMSVNYPQTREYVTYNKARGNSELRLQTKENKVDNQLLHNTLSWPEWAQCKCKVFLKCVRER